MVYKEELSISYTVSPEEVLKQLVHNFRAPIATIYGYATIIQRDAGCVGEYAGEIVDISKNLQVELRQVTDYLNARQNKSHPDED